MLFIYSAFHVFLLSISCTLVIPLCPSICIYSSTATPCFILALSPSLSPQIFHLRKTDHSTFHWPSSPSCSSASSSSSSCWYSPSVWPSAEVCCQYMLRSLVAAYLLLIFTSSFLVFLSDHPTTCHCGHRHTPMQGPDPHLRAPPSNLAPNSSQCKSTPLCLGILNKLQLCVFYLCDLGQWGIFNLQF